MHVRRALLLFAIVLGVAAVAASLSRPRQSAPDAPTATAPGLGAPGPGSRRPPLPGEVRFRAGGRATSKAIEAGQAAVVTVLAREPGLVELDGLGLSDTAEPGTPARFDVLSTRPGRFAVLFTPAGEPERERVGTLVVRTPRQS